LFCGINKLTGITKLLGAAKFDLNKDSLRAFFGNDI